MTKVDQIARGVARGARVSVGREELLFRADQSNGHSWLRCLVGAAQGDTSSRTRLEVDAEMGRDRGALERAGFSQTAGAGGEFVAPTYLLEKFAPALRGGRPFLNMLGTEDMPPAPIGQSLNFPKFTGGASTAVQTDGGAVSNTDPTTSLVTAQIQTTAGRTVYAWQTVDLNPYTEEILLKDLVFDLVTRMDAASISGAVTNAKGILNTASINSVTYTDATPTLAELWPFALQAASAIAKNGGVTAELAVTHPSAWYSFASTVDAAHPALVIPGLGNDLSEAADAQSGNGVVGNIAGIPLLVDANMPVNLGAGTNESRIALLNRQGYDVYESSPYMKVADQASATVGQGQLVAYSYMAQASRNPKLISSVVGSGLIPLAGF